MRASEERKRLAATIAVRTRCGADAEEINLLQARRRQLAVREIYCWALLHMKPLTLPEPAELRRVTREVRTLSHSMDRSGGEAA